MAQTMIVSIFKIVTDPWNISPYIGKFHLKSKSTENDQYLMVNDSQRCVCLKVKDDGNELVSLKVVRQFGAAVNRELDCKFCTFCHRMKLRGKNPAYIAISRYTRTTPLQVSTTLLSSLLTRSQIKKRTTAILFRMIAPAKSICLKLKWEVKAMTN